MSPKRVSLTSRPLDLLYFTFFLIHIPATLLLDLQALYPPALVPAQLARLPGLYLQMSGDPLIAGAFGLNGPSVNWLWFKSFMILEAVFQLPVFFIGLRTLWKGSRTVYPLLLIYAASTSTTTIPCLITILRTPLVSLPIASFPLDALLDPFSPTLEFNTPNAGIALGQSMLTITPTQRTMLLASYIPFLLIPLIMCVDMAVRVAGLVASGLRAEERERERERERKRQWDAAKGITKEAKSE